MILFTYFSGNEYTSTFGSNQYEGTLTQYIHDAFKPDLSKCILDGEMILYHAETGTYGMIIVTC